VNGSTPKSFPVAPSVSRSFPVAPSVPGFAELSRPVTSPPRTMGLLPPPYATNPSSIFRTRTLVDELLDSMKSPIERELERKLRNPLARIFK